MSARGTGRSDVVDIAVQLHGERPKAVLVSDSGERRDAVWLPRGLIEIEVGKRRIAVVTLPEWLAVEKGLV